MSTNASLNLVIQVSTDRRDGASLGLAGSRRQADDARRKLDMLFRYRNEYLARLNDGSDVHKIMGNMLGATDMMHLENARAFMDKLEVAISQQERETHACESYASACLQLLAAEEKKLKSLEILRDNRTKESSRQENRRDQKRTDEFGARAAHSGGSMLGFRSA